MRDVSILRRERERGGGEGGRRGDIRESEREGSFKKKREEEGGEREQIGKSKAGQGQSENVRGALHGRGGREREKGGGAYPFPGDLRAKFAWKEANRLSRGELIDNTAVTCSSPRSAPGRSSLIPPPPSPPAPACPLTP